MERKSSQSKVGEFVDYWLIDEKTTLFCHEKYWNLWSSIQSLLYNL